MFKNKKLFDRKRRPLFDRNTRVVIGLHAAREALNVRPDKVTEIWLKEGAERSNEHKLFIDFAKHRSSQLKVLVKPDKALDEIADSHQGVCLFLSETPSLDLDTVAGSANENVIVLALDEISDPHNVGAVLRTAWLLGVKGVIVTENRAAHLTPAATKVASGGAEHVPLYVSKNLSSDLNYLKDKGFWIYGLAADRPLSLLQTKFNEKVVLVVGNEERGLRSTTLNICDETIAIPQINSGASFNASVASAIALYEAHRQHKNP